MALLENRNLHVLIDSYLIFNGHGFSAYDNLLEMNLKNFHRMKIGKRKALLATDIKGQDFFN